MTDPGIPLLDLRGFRLERETDTAPIPILANLDLEIRRGETVAVIGPNGSGKSSLLRYLAGPDSPLTVPARLMVQDPDEQLVTATVAEELTLGRPLVEVSATLAAWGLAGTEGLDPRLLSAGQKQRLQLAVVLTGRPAVLLADEPSSLQDCEQAGWVARRIERWRLETGGTLVLATQRRREADRADRVVALANGTMLATGRPDVVLARSDVVALLDPGYPDFDPSAATVEEGVPPVAVWRGVGCRFMSGGGFAGVDLIVRPGDRVGVTGPNGCGKSTLLAVAAGLRRPDVGSTELSGRRLYARGDTDLDHGQAALAPQFPEYLFTRSTVAAEIAVDPVLAGVGIASFLETAGLAPDLADRDPHDLSGGERRRLALAVALRAGRPLVLLDEPTAALDAAGRRQVAGLVRAAPSRTAIVIASHDTEFLRACGCRLHGLEPDGLRAL